MSCCLYWVILEERLSVRVLASAVDDSECALHQALVLRPICVPEKVGKERKLYSLKK